MFKNLLDKGKCTLGFHAGEWRYMNSDTCQQVQVCERCDTESYRTAHNWPEWNYRAEGDCTLIRVCERCREEESKVDHIWGDWQYDPTPIQRTVKMSGAGKLLILCRAEIAQRRMPPLTVVPDFDVLKQCHACCDP